VKLEEKESSNSTISLNDLPSLKNKTKKNDVGASYLFTIDYPLP
jgi:hypothetical protein